VLVQEGEKITIQGAQGGKEAGGVAFPPKKWGVWSKKWEFQSEKQHLRGLGGDGGKKGFFEGGEVNKGEKQRRNTLTVRSKRKKKGKRDCLFGVDLARRKGDTSSRSEF